MTADGLLTVDELAEQLRIPEGTLRQWRAADRGPRSFVLSRRVLYRQSDVDEWVASQEQATARGGAA